MSVCASENEIRAAVSDALDGMRAAGCLSCPSFERCVGRLNAFSQSAPAPLRGGVRTANALGKTEKRETSRVWGRWFSRFRTTALAIAAAVSTFSASAVVQCVWDNNSGTYICSGEGSLVTVIGGGNGDVVITNVVGVCTNCVAMSPQYVRNWKETALREISFIDSELSAARMYARTITNDLYVIAHAPDGLQYYTDDTQIAAGYTSFVNDYISTKSDTLVYAAAYSAVSHYDSFDAASSANQNRAIVGAWNGALAYANQVAPTARDSIEYAEAIEGSVGYVIDERLPTMRVMIGDLSDEECTAQWDGGNDGGGSGATTNSLSGNWCTYDQGEAIKGLLSDLKEWGRQAVARLTAISNFTEQTVHTLRSGLFSDYTAIPQQIDWQTVYLQGQPTGWGYDPTNILQRLEMLVYGISGIGTNSNAFTTDDYPDESTVSSQITNAVNLTTDAATAQSGADTLGGALVDFFDLFSDLGGRQMQAGEFLLDDTSFQINDVNYDVPGLTASDNANLVGSYNLAQSLVSAAFTVVYCLFGIMAVWFYWTWFAEKALWFTKWISEVVNSLFAS